MNTGHYTSALKEAYMLRSHILNVHLQSKVLSERLEEADKEQQSDMLEHASGLLVSAFNCYISNLKHIGVMAYDENKVMEILTNIETM